MSDQLLEVLLYGDVTRSYFNMHEGHQNLVYRRLRDPGSGYQGPSQPRPVLTAYRDYKGPQASETYFHENGKWLNCETMSVWEGK